MDFKNIDYNNDPDPGAGRYKRRKKNSSYITLILLTLVIGISIGAICTLFVDSLLKGNEPEKTVVADAETDENSAEAEHDITLADIDEIREVRQEELEEEELMEELPDEADLLEEEPDIIIGGQEQEEQENQETESESQLEDETEEQPGEMGLLNLLKESLMQGEGTLPSLRKVFRDQIMVVAEGDFYFFPISDTLKKHGYNQENLFVDEKGRLNYAFEDGSRARCGVDVSKYQGLIDWEKVRNDGVDFAIIRSGVRGYGSGKLVMEEDFLANAAAASATGLEIGTYFFSQAVNTEEAIEEADCVIEALGGYSIAFPVVYDLERVTGGRMSNLTKEQMTANCLAFCNRIREYGYEPMIYGNMETLMLLLDMEQLEEYEKWLAYYNTDIYFPYNFRIWQYTEKGRVDGISGDVDLNLCFY